MTTQSANTVSQREQNIDAVRRGYEAFNTGDVETLAQLFDERAAWHTPGNGILGGDYQGRDATFAQFGRYVQETAGTFRAQLRFVTADDEGLVIAVHQNTGQRNGKQLDVYCCLVFHIKDGRVLDGRECFYDLGAWDEFWS